MMYKIQDDDTLKGTVKGSRLSKRVVGYPKKQTKKGKPHITVFI